MNHLNLEQRYQIIKVYFENNSSIRETHRKLRKFYGRHDRPSEHAIRGIVDKFRTMYTLHDVKSPTRRRNIRTEESISIVKDSADEDPNLSIRRRSQQLCLCPSTTWQILHKDLGLHPYKIQLVQEIKPEDHGMRRTFADWALDRLKKDPLFYRKIVFSDEAHFCLSGFVNKQNCRFWSEKNPKETFVRPLYPQKCTVWCGLHAGGIIGPYFFKNQTGNRVMVNGYRYRTMIKDYFFENMDNVEPNEVWFQQDGATCHTATETIDLLRTQFSDKIISRYGPVNWPPRSCDLTPVDYFLWGYVKSLVYTDQPKSIDELEASISQVIKDIRPEMLEKVCKNWTYRLEFVKNSRGGHMSEIIFKK